MSEKFIQIATFNYPYEMYILKTKLESEGIECNEYDSNTVTANPLLSNAIGGVKLMVKVEDAERAIKIMNRFYSEDTDTDTDTDANTVTNTENENSSTENEDNNSIQKHESFKPTGCIFLITAIIISVAIVAGISFI
jgi:hypothetical protein